MAHIKNLFDLAKFAVTLFGSRTKWTIRGLFSLYSCPFCTAYLVQLTGIEPQISGFGSNRSIDCTTTTAQYSTLIL